jgi:GPI-anchor transamidase subunit U
MLPNFASYPIFTHLLYIAVDIASAVALAQIAESGEAGASALFKSPRREKRWSGFTVAAA